MYHHQNQNQNDATRQGRAFGNTLDGNAPNKPNADVGKNGASTTFEKRQTRSMTKRNASKQLQPQPRSNANGNSNGADLAVQRPATTTLTTAMIAPTNPFIAPTSRPTAFSSISNLSSYQHTGNVDNIDARDKDDPLCATDYVQEMVSTTKAVAITLCHRFLFSILTQSCTSPFAVQPLSWQGGDHLCPAHLYGKSAQHQRADACHPRGLVD